MSGKRGKWRSPMDRKNIVIGILPEGEQIRIGEPMRIVVFPDREKLKESDFGTSIPAEIQETPKVTWFGIPKFSDLWKVQTDSGRIYYVMRNGKKDMGLVKKAPTKGREMVMYTISLTSPTSYAQVFCQKASGQMVYEAVCIDNNTTWKVGLDQRKVIVQVVV